MSDPIDEIARLEQLCERLISLAKRDPKQARRLGSGLERLISPPPKRPPGSRGNRRPLPVLDPFEINRTEPAALRVRLSELTIEQLRDVVAFHGMDPRRLVMKWKDRDRVIAHIEETVQIRSRKGDAFRGTSRPDPGGHAKS